MQGGGKGSCWRSQELCQRVLCTSPKYSRATWLKLFSAWLGGGMALLWCSN